MTAVNLKVIERQATNADTVLLMRWMRNNYCLSLFGGLLFHENWLNIYSIRRYVAMGIVEKLVKATLGEIEKVLSTRTVVGEPITVEGVTLIPLISVGFGFGAGGGEGKGETR